MPPELIRALELAEAALADIGDADREDGDDLAWAEARAAQDLPRIRQALNLWRNQVAAVAQPEPEGLTDEKLKQLAWNIHAEAGDGTMCGDVVVRVCRAAIAADRARYGRPAVAPVAQPEPEGVTLNWSEEREPCEECRYNHCIAETPFGKIVISWKGWKKYPGITVYEAPFSDWFSECWDSVEDAKSWCQAEYSRRLAAIVRQCRPAVAPVAVEALQRLRRWGGFTGCTGYSADVVLGVVDWIDGDMIGPLPPLPDYIAARATTPQEPQS